MSDYGIIGIRGTRKSTRRFKGFFAKKHCKSLTFINNEALINKNVLYKPWPVWEDLVVCNEAEENKQIVLKLNCFEFFKVSTKSHLPLLYQWNKDDNVSRYGFPDREVDQIEAFSILTKFFQTLRLSQISLLSSIYTSLLFIQLWKECKNGGSLYMLDSLSKFHLPKDSRDVYLLIPINDQFMVNFKNKKDIEKWIKKQRPNQITEVELFSTNKPGTVKNDFLVVKIRFLKAKAVKRASKPKQDKKYPSKKRRLEKNMEKSDVENENSVVQELEDSSRKLHSHSLKKFPMVQGDLADQRLQQNNFMLSPTQKNTPGTLSVLYIIVQTELYYIR